MNKGSNDGRLAAIGRTASLIAELVAGKPLTAQEAGDRLGLGAQAGARQLKAIQACLPGVVCDQSSRAHVWRYDQPAETLGYDKVIAACFGSSLAPMFEGTSFYEGFNVVREWLLKRSNYRRHFEDIDRKFMVLLQGGDVGVEPEDPDEPPLDDVLDAVIKERKLRLDYENFSGKRESLVVEPLSLILHQNRLYLIVRKRDRTLRSLKFARIHSAETLAKFAYPPPSAYSPQGAFRESYGVFLAKDGVSPVRFKLTPKWRAFVKTHKWHASQTHEEVADGVVITMSVGLCPELKDFLLGLGEDCEVLEPPKLRKEIAASALALAARYHPRVRRLRGVGRG